jgi:phospholipid/cholesterol/gamma-HCH transport system substrate-binding protein
VGLATTNSVVAASVTIIVMDFCLSYLFSHFYLRGIFEGDAMKAQTKVGILLIVSVLLLVGFAFALGTFQPFSNTNELKVAYNFAGGLDVGSPVRVMGIKVGKVRSIKFEPDFKMPKSGEEVKLIITITVNKDAWPTIRQDSQFFINLAGVIGEKFLEISPGSAESPQLEPGQVVRGEDPPRIDQLISQSYALAGKILAMVNKHEGSVTETIETLDKLVVNFDKMLKQLEKTSRDPEVHKIVKNLSTIMDDGAFFTQKVRSPEGQKFMVYLTDLLKRLEPLDAKAIKKFLQEEGIRARLF